ncbi:hypothetical protein, partial [Paraburkholderia unamae]
MTCQIQINRLPDMPNKKNSRSTRRPVAGTHAKSLYLPMPRHEASDLALRVSAGVNPTLNDDARLSESLKNKGAAQAPSSSMTSIRTADRA